MLFLLGLRVVLDGGGWPHLRFMESADEQAARIATHRAEQREQGQQGEQLPAIPEDVPQSAPTDTAADTAPPAAPSMAPAAVPALRDVVSNAPPVASSAPSSAWADFRGPRRDGVYRGPAIQTTWPAAGLTPLWKQPIGGGYASFVVAGRPGVHDRAARRVRKWWRPTTSTTGRELWTTAWDGEFQESMGGDGPRATPTWADGRVYALGAMGELRCLDAATGSTRLAHATSCRTPARRICSGAWRRRR